MKLSHIYFAFFVLVGMAMGQETATNETATNSTTRRFEWADAVSDEEADGASEHIRTDWNEGVAEFDPFEALTQLEKLQLYNEWKTEAWSIVSSNPNARFKLHKNIQPEIKFFNTFAEKAVCVAEMQSFFARLGRAMNGILGSSELGAEQEWYTDSDLEGGLRGRRELSGCGNCPKPSGYFCGYCGNGRRRLQGETEEVTLRENTPENMEALVSSTIGDLQGQCEKTLKSIAAFSGDLDLTCTNCLKGIKCEVTANVWDVLSLIVDGTEYLAADMIEAKLLESTSRR